MAMCLRVSGSTDGDAVPDRPTKSRSCLHAAGVAGIWVKINTEASPSRRRESRRKPELKFGCAAAADQQMRSPRGAYPDDTIAPAFECEAQVAECPCPGHRPHDRQNGCINFRSPGDRWFVDRGRTWIGCERSGPNGTTSLPTDASIFGQPVERSGRRPLPSSGWRGAPNHWRRARCRGIRDYDAAIPKRSPARSMRSLPDTQRVSVSGYILAS